MEPDNWEQFWMRFQLFCSNTWSLWQKANADQKIFLATWATLTLLFLYVIYRHLKWRFLNRLELNKMEHYKNMRQFIFDMRDGEPNAVRKLPAKNSTGGTSSDP